MSKRHILKFVSNTKREFLKKNQQNDDCSLKKCLSLQMKSVFPT